MNADDGAFTYSEVGLTRKQTVRLSGDTLRVNGQVILGAAYDFTSSVRIIAPSESLVVARDPFFGHSIIALTLSGVAAIIYHALPGTSIDTFLGGAIANGGPRAGNRCSRVVGVS